MIHPCENSDFETIYAIINDAAQAYKPVIPRHCWKEPYMPREELHQEIEHGVRFWGCEEEGKLLGVMGIQEVKDVSLIRHAYVRPRHQNRGIGGRLLTPLRGQTLRPMLVGTWAAAVWAIRFYERHGFRLVTTEEKNRLLRKYWSLPDTQIEASVVLADSKWCETHAHLGLD